MSRKASPMFVIALVMMLLSDEVPAQRVPGSSELQRQTDNTAKTLVKLFDDDQDGHVSLLEARTSKQEALDNAGFEYRGDLISLVERSSRGKDVKASQRDLSEGLFKFISSKSDEAGKERFMQTRKGIVSGLASGAFKAGTSALKAKLGKII